MESRSCMRQSWGLQALGGSRVGPGARLPAMLISPCLRGTLAPLGTIVSLLARPWSLCISPSAHLGSLGIWGHWAVLSNQAESEGKKELLVPGAHTASSRGLCSVAEAAAHCLLKGSREWRGQKGHEDSGLSLWWERQCHEQEELCAGNPELAV